MPCFTATDSLLADRPDREMFQSANGRIDLVDNLPQDTGLDVQLSASDRMCWRVGARPFTHGTVMNAISGAIGI